jgi:hypothetical protein
MGWYVNAALLSDMVRELVTRSVRYGVHLLGGFVASSSAATHRVAMAIAESPPNSSIGDELLTSDRWSDLSHDLRQRSSAWREKCIRSSSEGLQRVRILAWSMICTETPSARKSVTLDVKLVSPAMFLEEQSLY